MTGDSGDMHPADSVATAESVERVLAAARALADLSADEVGLPDPDPWARPNLDGGAAHRAGLSVGDLRRAGLAAGDLDDPDVMDNAWR